MGLRGVICERFGWTMKYLLHGIPWIDVHTMMVDAPQYIPPTPKPSGTNVTGQKATPPEEKEEPKTNGDKLLNFLNTAKIK